MIPIGEQRTCTVTSAAKKLVICEECHKPYLYLTYRQGQGTAENLLWLRGDAAAAEAQLQAEADVRQLLAEAVEPVPCPRCGRYQANMIGPARSYYRTGWHRFGFWLMVLDLLPLIICYIIVHSDPRWRPGRIAFYVTLALFVGGLAMMIVRFVKSRRFNPNDLPVAQRLLIGRAMARIPDLPEEAGYTEDAPPRKEA